MNLFTGMKDGQINDISICQNIKQWILIKSYCQLLVNV